VLVLMPDPNSEPCPQCNAECFLLTWTARGSADSALPRCLHFDVQTSQPIGPFAV